MRSLRFANWRRTVKIISSAGWSIPNAIVLYRPNFWSLHTYLASIHRFPYKFLYKEMSDNQNLVQKQKIGATILDNRKAGAIAQEFISILQGHKYEKNMEFAIPRQRGQNGDFGLLLGL